MTTQNKTLEAELLALRAENEALKARAQSHLSYRVSEKGGVSVYGIGRFPVTLYSSQWERLLAKSDAIKQFIVDNGDKLAVKPAKQ